VPSCVNILHLFLGTKSDNANDAVSKSRWRPPKKLTVDQVAEIRRRVEGGEAQRIVARDYPVAYQTISKIVRRESWR
jgi:hypothetical protein